METSEKIKSLGPAYHFNLKKKKKKLSNVKINM